MPPNLTSSLHPEGARPQASLPQAATVTVHSPRSRTQTSPSLVLFVWCVSSSLAACVSTTTPSNTKNRQQTPGYDLETRKGCTVVSSCSSCGYTATLTDPACKATGWVEALQCGETTDSVPCEGRPWYLTTLCVATLILTILFLYSYRRFFVYRANLENHYMKKALGSTLR